MRSCSSLMLLLLALSAVVHPVGALQIDARETVLEEYLVVGTVVWANAGSSSVAVRGSNLLGYLRFRVRSYRVKQPSDLVDLRPGDTITAVFSRSDGMLHRVRRVRVSVKSGPAPVDKTQ